jgi:hypothetical protein
MYSFCHIFCHQVRGVVKVVLKGGMDEHSLANRFRVLSKCFWEALALQWSAHGLLQMTNQPFGKLQSFKEYHTAWSLTNFKQTSRLLSN